MQYKLHSLISILMHKLKHWLH